jgi:transcription elongation factor GreA
MAMAKQVILTDEGLRKLEEELEQLKTEKRKEIAEKIKIALSFGDLSENSEYDEAKNEQAMVESRITQLEVMLKNVKLIDEEDIKTDSVSIGTKVKVLDVEFNEEIEYHIVGSTESDPDKNRISDESPVGKALIGHKMGETVVADSPGGVITFKILQIKK